MSASKDKSAALLAIHDLDRVALTQALIVDGVTLAQGRIGTVVFCHGAEAYEVEFEGIDDFFQIRSGFLSKIN